MSRWEAEGSEEEKQGGSHEDKWSGKSGNLILFLSSKHTAFLCHLKNKYTVYIHIVGNLEQVGFCSNCNIPNTSANRLICFSLKIIVALLE